MPGQVSAAFQVQLTYLCPLCALFIYLRALSLSLCVFVHTTWSHTWLAPAQVVKFAGSEKEREKKSERAKQAAILHVWVCVCVLLRVQTVRGLLYLYLPPLSPSHTHTLTHAHPDPHVKRAGSLLRIYLHSVCGQRSTRTRAPPKRRERDSDNRVPCTVYPLNNNIITTIANHMWNTIYHEHTPYIRLRSHFKYAICAFSFTKRKKVSKELCHKNKWKTQLK